MVAKQRRDAIALVYVSPPGTASLSRVPSPTLDQPRPVAHVRAGERCAWRGLSLLVTDERGDCGGPDSLTGLYVREARHLKRLKLEVNGERPWLCSDGNALPDELDFAFVYPELTQFGGGGTDVSGDTSSADEHGVPYRGVDLRLRYEVRFDGMDAILTLANRSHARIELDVAWLVAADFADIQEAPSGERQQCADVDVDSDLSSLRFRYLHPDLPLETLVTLGGSANTSVGSDGRLAMRLALDPRQIEQVVLQVDAIDPEHRIEVSDAAHRLEHLARWREHLARFDTPGAESVQRLLRQAADDIGALTILDGPEDEWLAVQAGMPHYPALFGRDTLTVGWQAAVLDQGAILDASLTTLGRLQSARVDAWHDEEPGRIPYQVRRGPLARLNLNPFASYYADQASPFMFVIGLAHLFAWTGNKAAIVRHRDVARRILDWAREYGDRDRDGYLEYETKSSKGAKNQGWKDSGNAIQYEDGRTVPAPLATCEIQGYWFAAQQLMAVMCWAMGDHDDAKAYWRSAMDLKRRLNHDWWMDAEGFVALALDADKRQVKSIASNAGHCLATGIVSNEHIPPVIGRLFAPDMFSGWGIRTLSSEHPSYNPLGYHLGTVWPVENATIAFGLRRYGFDQRALEIARSTIDLASLYERGRIPECVGGYARAGFSHPGAYPRTNPLQTWNQSAFPLMLHTILGLQPVAPLDLLVVDPVLPSWLPEVIVRGLRVGGATVTLRFWRDDRGRSHAEVVRKRGTLHLIHQPPPESLRHGVRDRLGALAGSMRYH